MPDVPKDELHRLLSGLCDEGLTPEEGERLAEILTASSAARVAYVRFIDMHASLRQEMSRANVGSEFDHKLLFDEELGLPAELCQQIALQPSPLPLATVPATRWPARRWAASLVGLATAIAISVFAWWQFVNPPLQPPLRTPLVVARLASATNCTWDAQSLPLVEGASLHAGQRLILTSGVARLEFSNQATALVESPATVELISDSSLRLHSGTLALRATNDRKDFIVHTASASIVDHGTSFGVHSGPNGVDIEVFEGAVEVLPDNDTQRAQILGLGTSARLASASGESNITMFGSDQGRFTDLLQMLWDDMQSDANGPGPHPVEPKGVPRAEFDGPIDTYSVDSFHGSQSGNGWVTPWVASGNPVGQIFATNALSGPDNRYLKVRFFGSMRRTIAREYGETDLLDPTKPHVISWVWRFEGTDPDFGDSFDDRVAFYGMPYFRDNSSEDTNWMIGWAGDHEKVGSKRRGIPKHWFAFDGTKGSAYDTSNLVDTGMALKPDVTYRMAVVLYPATRQYDAIIQDDQQTFVASGLSFRSTGGLPGRVVHFGVGTDRAHGDAAFSIDSVRIEPLRPDLIPHDLHFNVPSDPGTIEANIDSSAPDAMESVLQPVAS